MMYGEDKKLQDLQAQIDALKQKTAPKPDDAARNAASMSAGMRAGTELVGAILGSALIGYGFDQWWGTKPWALIVMLVLGVFTGFLNVWKTTQNQSTPHKNDF